MSHSLDVVRDRKVCARAYSRRGSRGAWRVREYVPGALSYMLHVSRAYPRCGAVTTPRAPWCGALSLTHPRRAPRRIVPAHGRGRTPGAPRCAPRRCNRSPRGRVLRARTPGVALIRGRTPGAVRV